jgi:hypothetical protein
MALSARRQEEHRLKASAKTFVKGITQSSLVDAYNNRLPPAFVLKLGVPERRIIAISSAVEKKEEVAQLQESRRQPVWHVIVLHILTLATYSPFWFAKNWSLLIHAHKLAAGEEEADDRLVPLIRGEELVGFKGKDPILLTVGMFIPLVNLFLAFLLFQKIANLETNKTTFRAQHPAITATLLLGAMTALYLLGYLPSTYFLLCLSSFAPMALAQHWLNQYWKDHEPPDALVRQAFSSLELCAVIFGSLLLGVVIITPFVIPK